MNSDYVLLFHAKRVEADVGSEFLTKAGALGAAAARAETDFALTHSEKATSRLVTESLTPIRIPIAAKTMAMVPDDVRKQYQAAAGPSAGATIVLPARARMNLTASRTGASINGTLVGTMSGQGSVLLKDIFTESQPLTTLLANHSLTLDQMKALAEQMQTGMEVKRTLGDETAVEDLEALATSLSRTVAASVPVPFQTIPVRYSNWSAHQAVVAVAQPSIHRLMRDSDGAEIEVKVDSVVWHEDAAETRALAESELALQKMYDTSWSLVENLKFEIENLTKSVMRVPVGYNGSRYAPAAAVNDTPAKFADATLEQIVSACLRTELDTTEHAQLLKELETPSIVATAMWAPVVANAMSAFSAFSMPYRVDGTPTVTPTGLKMVESESWRSEASRSIFHSDDCDGSAADTISTINRAVSLNDSTSAEEMASFPALRAVANSLGAHYVFGTTVLAANAGHADAANEKATSLAGHAIAMALPKASFAMALERGALGSIPNVTDLAHSVRSEVTRARFEALYPETLTARMPEAERTMVSSYETMKKQPVLVNPVTGLQPLSMEGTSFASSRLYTHDPLEREERAEWYRMDKRVATSLSPNITRTHKTLDIGDLGEHAFYHAKVEMSFSMKHPLCTNATLRKHGQASPHYRFARPSSDGVMSVAGASPKALATGDYAVVPLWSVDAKVGATLDLAHSEAAANTMPMRGVPQALATEEVISLDRSLAALVDLKTHLELNREVEQPWETHMTRHVVSFASLVQNPNAIEAFVETVRGKGGVVGEVRGLGSESVLEGLAIDPTGIQCGRMVLLDLHVPLDSD